MKRWIQIGAIALVTATALALGLSSVSAGAAGNPPPSPPLASGNTPSSQVGTQEFRPADPEAMFKAITPCRIVDTRRGGGLLTNNTPRAFYVTGTTGFASQGGTSAGCGIPTAATGVTTNVTAAGTVSDGYLTGYPTGSTPPTTNFMTTHKNFNLTANPTFALTAGNATPLTLTNHGGNTHIIVDVTGYYLPQIQAVLVYDGTANSPDGVYRFSGNRYGSPRVLTSQTNSTGNYRVTIDRDLTGCTAMASIYGGPFVASATIYQNVVLVYTYRLDNTNGSTSGTPVNVYWTLHVMC